MRADKPKRLGNLRVTGKEQYYTPPALAEKLIKDVETAVGPLRGRTVIEPAGGTGAFVTAAQNRGAKVVSFDIEPHHPDITVANFLDVEVAFQNAITISNPPFGRNNALSIPFFNKAAAFSDAIAFIVPRSWRKWSVTNRLDLNFHLLADHDLQIDYVDASGEQLMERKLLSTCFQIWTRQEKPRVPVRVEDLGIVEKTSPEEADVALVVFGFSCGTVLTDFERKPNTTRMFLKLNHPRALEALTSVDFSRFSSKTAYTPALALPEINYLLNEYIFGKPGIIGSK